MCCYGLMKLHHTFQLNWFFSFKDYKIADNKIKQYEMQLENLYKQNLSLSSEVKHLNMLAITSNTNKNDSRYY